MVDAHKVLINSPRAGADVVVYVTANEIALVDRLHLRFIGQVPGAPSVIELDVDLDTRATDDEQRAALEPVFVRGLALYVGARYSTAVAVTLSVPTEMTVGKSETSPWGVSLSVTANGNYTDKYQSATSELGLAGTYLTPKFRSLAAVIAQGGLNRQPPLMLDNGTYVSLDSNQWAIDGGAEAIHLFNDTWSIGIGSYQRVEDPKAQYRFNSRSRAALEWDLFPANDPRGNKLAVFYHIGWAFDRYNIRNVLGETFAQYPLHGIDAIGSVRHDKISYGLTLSSDVEVNHPLRRHLFTAAPFVSIQIGDHVDLNLAFSVTQRELPAPDPAAIDPSDYAQLSRLSYAEPLAITSTLGLTIHWDPTNGARNNRLQSI